MRIQNNKIIENKHKVLKYFFNPNPTVEYFPETKKAITVLLQKI